MCFHTLPHKVPSSDRRVLDVLEDNGGAVLYWQVGSDADAFVSALKRDVIRFDSHGDLYVHPRAVRVDEFGYELN